MKMLYCTAALFPFMIGPAFAQEATVDEPAAAEGSAVEEAPAVEADGATEDTNAGAESGTTEQVPVVTEEALADATDEEPADAGDDAATAPAEAVEETPIATNDAVVEEQAASEVRGDWIDGATIMSPEDEVIGNIEDLIINTDEGTVSAAIVSVGGFLGIGAKQIAVDWNELQIDYDGQEITLAMTREEAENAPQYAFREQEPLPPPPPVDATGGTAGGMGGAPAAPVAPLE